MGELVDFFTSYGLVFTGIAILGIVVLGCLKYFNLFKKFGTTKRHYIYLAISVGFTVIATLVYQLITSTFDSSEFLTMSGTVYTLNQTFYNLFKITPVNKLGTALLTNTLELCGVKKSDFEEPEEEKIEPVEETESKEADAESEEGTLVTEEKQVEVEKDGPADEE